MSGSRRIITRLGNRFGVWVYRRSGGRLAGPGMGTTIALITVPGRKTRVPRTTAIGLQQYGSEYLAIGTGSGSVREPDWFQNLRVASQAEVQIRCEHFMVKVRVADPVERDRLWQDVVLVQAPQRERYARKSGRLVPVAVLSRADSQD